jgi:hypothetical protein
MQCRRDEEEQFFFVVTRASNSEQTPARRIGADRNLNDRRRLVYAPRK